MKIPINQLKTCPINSEIYRDSDVGDLVNSIGEVGLLQPIVVTPCNTIVSGHRRFEAIQSLGWVEVEVEVKDIPHDEIDVHIVLYNQSRVKVATEMLREIKVLYKNLWTGKGSNYGGGKKPDIRDVISKNIGISAGSIHKLLFIEENQPDLLKMIDIGDMTINGAYTETKRHLNFISLSEYVSKRKKDIPLNIENLTIYNKSSEDMLEVDSGSVQTIVTSPPYYQKRSYQVDGQIGLEKSIDEHLSRLMTVMSECKRVLKEDGSMFLVIGDSYDERGSLRQVPHRLSLAMSDDGWILRNTLVWHKLNAKPENGKIKRWGTSYEFIFFFTLSTNYYFNMDKVRVPYLTEFSSGAPRHHKTDEKMNMGQQTNLHHPLGRVPRDFIGDDIVQTTLNNSDKFVPDKNLEHSATYPEKLIKPFILGTSIEGDTILDPFLGSGTTAKVSLDNGRKCIGYEISPVFVDTSFQRCGDDMIQERVKVV